MNKVVTFILNAGGSIVSKNILSHKGKLRWCVREESVNDVDNGWRFFSDIDTEEYLSKADNMCICELNTFVPDRLLDDDGAALIRYEGGAKGVLTASQIAVGVENGLNIRVYGEKGGLEWRQEEPNTMIMRWPDRPAPQAVQVRF